MYGDGARYDDEPLDSIEGLAEQEYTRYMLRDPRIAAVLSGLVMGLGQLFNAQYKRAFVFFGGEVALFLYLWDYAAGLPVSQTLIGFTSPGLYRVFLSGLSLAGIGLWIFNIRDAYRMAEFSQFIFDRAFPILDEEEEELVARHLTINRAGLSYHSGLSRKMVFLGAGVLIYSVALVALGGFYLGRRNQVEPRQIQETAREMQAVTPLPVKTVDPKDPSARLQEGEAAFDRGDMDRASSEFMAVLSLKSPPRLRYQAYLNLGRVASARQDNDLATKMLMEAVRLSREMSAATEKQPSKPILEARKALKQGDASGAEKLLAPVADDWRSWLPLGRAAASRNDWERSRKFLTAYVAAPAPEPEGYLELARAEFNVGRRQEAISHARRYLQLVPGDPDGSLVLASALEVEGGPREAYGVVETALAAHPRDARLLAEAMQLAEVSGNLDQAAQVARALLRIDPGNGRARDLVEASRKNAGPAERLKRVGRESAAEAPAKQKPATRIKPAVTQGHRKQEASSKPAVRSKPKAPKAAKAESSSKPAERADREREARLLYGVSGRDDPPRRSSASVDSYADSLREAELAFASGNDARAMKHYEAVLSSRPDHPRSMLQRALLLHRRGETSRAVMATTEIVRVHRDDTKTLSDTGQLLIDMEKFEQATGTFDRVLELEPRNLAALYASGEILERQGALEGAEKRYLAIQRFYPELTEVHDYLGNLYYRQDRFQESLVQYQDLLKAGGEDPSIRFKIGMVHYRMGEVDRARDTFRLLESRLEPGDSLYAQLKEMLSRLPGRTASR